MEAEPHLPSWYLMPEARDKKRRWYRVQCTYRTRLLNGEIQGYMSSEWSENTQKALKQAQAGLQEERGEREKECIESHVMLQRWDSHNSNFGSLFHLRMCNFSWSSLPQTLGAVTQRSTIVSTVKCVSPWSANQVNSDVRKKNNNFPVYHRASRYKQHSSSPMIPQKI